ncbi:MAG: hypothetical protein MI861_26535 [Pirellulales bacterium]|nr:hypothetical protein [Pirellulales bacterium]
MNARISSWFVGRIFVIAIAATVWGGTDANAQTGAGYYTNPDTGIVYQQVIRTVERPVVETKMQTRQQTVYRPQTVTNTRPETRTVYTPIVEYNWEPRIHGRWNPFRQPYVAYHHVPRARWEQHSDVVQRTTTHTEWVAEKRTIDIPQRVVRMEREQKVDYEPVGRVAPNATSPPGATNSVASRLRPLSPSTRVVPLNSSLASANLASARISSPRIAASTTGNPSNRSTDQTGMRTKHLVPSPNVRGPALPSASSGIATLPSTSYFR